METLVTGAWVGLREGCEITSDVGGSDIARLTVLGSGQPFEMEFQAEPLRQFIESATQTLAEMETLAVREGASQAAREHAEADETAGVRP
jgi:hypothetical protein